MSVIELQKWKKYIVLLYKQPRLTSDVSNHVTLICCRRNPPHPAPPKGSEPCKHAAPQRRWPSFGCSIVLLNKEIRLKKIKENKEVRL